MCLFRRFGCNVLLACVGLSHAVPAAHADLINGRSGGSLVITRTTPTSVEGVFNEFIFKSDGAYLFRTLQVNFIITLQDQQPDLFAASLLFTDSIGQTLSAVITDGVRYINPDGLWSGSGPWTVTVGTGQYADFTGGGSFVFGVLPDDARAFSSFEGDIVPAPSALMMLGVGGVCASARRRRS